jgi:hypothetical protein
VKLFRKGPDNSIESSAQIAYQCSLGIESISSSAWRAFESLLATLGSLVRLLASREVFCFGKGAQVRGSGSRTMKDCSAEPKVFLGNRPIEVLRHCLALGHLDDDLRSGLKS